MLHMEETHSSEELNQNAKFYQDELAGDLLTQIAFALSRGSKSNCAKAEALRSEELSKQARKELAKKLENKSLDWGQYER